MAQDICKLLPVSLQVCNDNDNSMNNNNNLVNNTAILNSIAVLLLKVLVLDLSILFWGKNYLKGRKSKKGKKSEKDKKDKKGKKNKKEKKSRKDKKDKRGKKSKEDKALQDFADAKVEHKKKLSSFKDTWDSKEFALNMAPHDRSLVAKVKAMKTHQKKEQIDEATNLAEEWSVVRHRHRHTEPESQSCRGRQFSHGPTDTGTEVERPTVSFYQTCKVRFDCPNDKMTCWTRASS